MGGTPAFLAGGEEAHIKKMLDAGVIQPSVSEWTSAPVLIRKEDGQVRFCLDYRRLNNLTRKDVFPLRLIDECLEGVTKTRNGMENEMKRKICKAIYVHLRKTYIHCLCMNHSSFPLTM